MDWFRSHHGAPTDPKLRLVAKRCNLPAGTIAAIWWALLDHASQAEDRGSVASFDAEVCAIAFDYPVDDVRRAYETLCNAGLVSECFRLVSWERRQPKREGSSTDRVRKHRAEKKGKNGDETHETNDGTRKPLRAEQSRAEIKERAGARHDVSIGLGKRRLTDDERALASAATGDVPAECGDADVARWQRMVEQRRARTGHAGKVVPIAAAPEPAPAETPAPPPAIEPAPPSLAPPAAPAEDELEIPAFMDRRKASA
jgi:hypothetical protein